MTSRHSDVKDPVFPGSFGWDGYHRRIVHQEGGNTPKVLRDQKIFLENPYVGTKDVTINPLIAVGTSASGPRNYLAGAHTLGGIPNVYPSELSYPEPSDLLGKVMEKWKGSKFNVGVTLGEGKESAEMMYHRIGGILSSVRSLKRGNIGGALRSLTGQVPKKGRQNARALLDGGDVSGAFLELNLGWSPMIKDIHELAHLLQFKGRRHRLIVSRAMKGVPRVNGNNDHWKVTGKCEKRTSIIVDVYREPTLMEALGLTDPAGVMWELVPLSFVVDWFFPIGNYLNGLHAVGRLPAKKVIITKSEKLHGYSKVIANPVAGFYHDGVHPRVTCRKSHVNRVIYDSMWTAFTVTDFLPTSVTAKWDPSLWKLATASSLLHQALQGLPGSRRTPIGDIQLSR